MWVDDSTWIGNGQTVTVLVDQELSIEDAPTLPQFSFAVTVYPNGDNLISWEGNDGAYQLYTPEAIFPQGKDLLVQTEVTDSDGDYTLFLFQIEAPLPPNAESLTLAALPQPERDRVEFLTAVRQQISDDLAAHGNSNTQNGVLKADLDAARYFRLVISRKDSDGDGLYDDLERRSDFNLNPYDSDTDQDGVADPWSHALLNNTGSNAIDTAVIREFMALNDDLFCNEKGDCPDYVEIFNPTSATINLSGWHLSDKTGNRLKWQFPGSTNSADPDSQKVLLEPGASLVVYADSNNTSTTLSQPFSTGFGLNAGGENIILTRPDGITADEHLNFGRQRLNASAGWGLDQNTGLISKLRFFLDATPGFENSFFSCLGFTLPPEILVKGSVIFESKSFTVAITSSEVGAVIHYTTDGSNPDSSSPIYDPDPVNGTSIVIDSTTVLRAVTIRPDCPPSPLVTRSYLYIEDVLGTAAGGSIPTDHQTRPLSYPTAVRTSSGGTSGILDYAMNPEIIAEEKAAMASGFLATPIFAISLPVSEVFGIVDGFYANSSVFFNTLPSVNADPLGLDWKRLASFEIIDPGDPNNPNDNGSYSQENGEVTISGASSRNYQVSAKHNLRLIFKARNSLQGNSRWTLDSDLFLTSSNRSLRQVQLRNPTQDSWTIRNRLGLDPIDGRNRTTYVKDIWARDAFREMRALPQPVPGGRSLTGLPEPEGNLIAHRRWVHLFINGLYWGIYDLTERIDENLTRTYLDRSADYDVLKGKPGGVTGTLEVVDGDTVAWNDLISACDAAAADNTSGALWNDVTDLLDLPSYLDYLLVNLYMHNADWGANGNNWRAIRRRAANSKFRFMIWDAEVAMNPTNFGDTFYDNGAGALRPHSILKGHPEYRRAFQDCLNYHYDNANGLFAVTPNGNRSADIFQAASSEVAPLMSLESARWGDASRQPGETAYSHRVSDPDYLSGSEFGDFQRSSLFHRAVFLPNRRAPFRTSIENKLSE